MQAQIYDFAIAAGGAVRVAAAGSSVKLLSSTGAIEIQTDTGARVKCMPGQGIRHFDFQTVILVDKSGGANSGLILVTDGEMIDDRITGEVSVIDGSTARTMSGKAMMAYGSSTSVGANHPYVQFLNTSGAGKIVSIKSMLISSNTAGFIGMGIYSTQLANFVQYSQSKKAGGGTGITASYRDENAAFLYATNLTGAFVPANGSFSLAFSDPIVLPAGYGLAVAHNALAAGTLLTVSAEIYEDTP